jgi:hypothetical protein
MEMEHRCSRRRPIEISVAINYRDVMLVLGRTRDISLDGMFVNTGRQKLPRNALVRVSLRIRDFGSWTGEAEAMVVHSDDDGLGLMFTAMDAHLEAELQAFLDNEFHQSDETRMPGHPEAAEHSFPLRFHR